MTVTAVVEKLNEKRYRATISLPFPLESEGSTADEAISRLRQRALEKLRVSQLVEFQLPDDPNDNPWMRMAGIWKDHPDFDEYLANVEEYRRERNAMESH